MGWPVTSGDYVVGDPKSPVAVVTLASDYRSLDLKNYASAEPVLRKISGLRR